MAVRSRANALDHVVADRNHVKIDGLPAGPDADVPPEVALSVLRNFLATLFPLLDPSPPVVPPRQSKLTARQL